MTTAPLVFLDTETTSLRPDRRVWEVAMIRVDADAIRTTSMFVADVDLTEADPAALKIGRFHERHPRHQLVSTTAPLQPLPSGVWCLSESTVADKVEQFTRGATLVGAVPSFDAEGLAAMLRRHKLCPTWHHRLIDVESMGITHVGLGEDGRPRGLGKLATALGIVFDPADAHTALADAQLARKIYEALA